MTDRGPNGISLQMLVEMLACLLPGGPVEACDLSLTEMDDQTGKRRSVYLQKHKRDPLPPIVSGITFSLVQCMRGIPNRFLWYTMC